jgi:hypothetical protein
MTQLLEAARELVQVEVESSLYSGSEKTKLLKVTGEDPAFVTVKVALVLPVTPRMPVPRLKLVAENLREAVVPLPVRLMVVGLVKSESVTVNVPFRVPAVFGVKSMYTVQLLEAAKVVPQVEAASWVNSESE